MNKILIELLNKKEKYFPKNILDEVNDKLRIERFKFISYDIAKGIVIEDTKNYETNLYAINQTLSVSCECGKQFCKHACILYIYASNHINEIVNTKIPNKNEILLMLTSNTGYNYFIKSDEINFRERLAVLFKIFQLYLDDNLKYQAACDYFFTIQNVFETICKYKSNGKYRYLFNDFKICFLKYVLNNLDNIFSYFCDLANSVNFIYLLNLLTNVDIEFIINNKKQIGRLIDKFSQFNFHNLYNTNSSLINIFHIFKIRFNLFNNDQETLEIVESQVSNTSINNIYLSYLIYTNQKDDLMDKLLPRIQKIDDKKLIYNLLNLIDLENNKSIGRKLVIKLIKKGEHNILELENKYSILFNRCFIDILCAEYIYDPGQNYNILNNKLLEKYPYLEIFLDAVNDFDDLKRKFHSVYMNYNDELLAIFHAKILSLVQNIDYLSDKIFKDITDDLNYLLKLDNGLYYAIDAVSYIYSKFNGGNTWTLYRYLMNKVEDSL